jgi:hypothetical protein
MVNIPFDDFETEPRRDKCDLLERRLGGPQGQSGRRGEKKIHSVFKNSDLETFSKSHVKFRFSAVLHRVRINV